MLLALINYKAGCRSRKVILKVKMYVLGIQCWACSLGFLLSTFQFSSDNFQILF